MEYEPETPTYLTTFTLATDFPYMNHYRPTSFIHRWRSIDPVTLSLRDVTGKQTSRLVNVTFEWRQVMRTAVQRYGRTGCLVNFSMPHILHINTESLKLIHRNDRKIKCKYKSKNCSSGDEASDEKILQEALCTFWNFTSAHWLHHPMNVKKSTFNP